MHDVLEIYGYHGTSQIRAIEILERGFRPSDNYYPVRDKLLAVFGEFL